MKNERKEDEELEKARNNFADLTAMACLLCQRKFKSKADLERHQDISELHKVKQKKKKDNLCFWELLYSI